MSPQRQFDEVAELSPQQVQRTLETFGLASSAIVPTTNVDDEPIQPVRLGRS